MRNRIAAGCFGCRVWVRAGDGFLERSQLGTWRVRCARCEAVRKDALGEPLTVDQAKAIYAHTPTS